MRNAVNQNRVWIEPRWRELPAGPPEGDRGARPGSCSTTRRSRLEGWRGASRCSARTPTCGTHARVANRAVARRASAWGRRPDRRGRAGVRSSSRSWLLNLPGLADPHDAHRETVDRLFFPTGGNRSGPWLRLRWCSGGCGVPATTGWPAPGERHPALHAAPADAGSARAHRRSDLRAGNRAERADGRYGRVAVRDRGVGGEGGAAERPGPQGRQPLGLGARRSRRSKRDPDRIPVARIPLEKLPWVPDALRARLVHAAAGRRPAARDPRRLRRPSSASSVVTARCRSSPWTSRSIGCRRS